MEKKDWIILLVPIFSNWIILYLFQQFITIKIEGVHKREAIKRGVYICFWEELKILNSNLINASLNIKKGLSNELFNVGKIIIPVSTYYEINKYDLKIIEKKYLFLIKSWQRFEKT